MTIKPLQILSLSLSLSLSLFRMMFCLVDLGNNKLFRTDIISIHTMICRLD